MIPLLIPSPEVPAKRTLLIEPKPEADRRSRTAPPVVDKPMEAKVTVFVPEPDILRAEGAYREVSEPSVSVELLPTNSSKPPCSMSGVPAPRRPEPFTPPESSSRSTPPAYTFTALALEALPPAEPLSTTVPLLTVRFPVKVFVPVRESVPEP